MIMVKIHWTYKQNKKICMLDVKLKGKNGVLNIRNKQLETSSLVKLEVEGDLHLNQRIS